MSSFKNMVTTQLHFTLETGRQVAKMADPQINICSVAFVPREQAAAGYLLQVAKYAYNAVIGDSEHII